MTKLAFLSLAVLTFGAFAAEPKIPAESQAVLFLDLAKSLALPAFKDVAVPDEPFAPGMPKLKDVKWALLTADKVVIPPPNAKSYALPSLALAVSGTFDAKAALEASVKSEGPDGIKLTPLAGLPFPAWSIPVDQLPAAAEQEELKKITNLKPCVGAVAKDGEQEVNRPHGIIFIFARDTLGDAQDTLHLATAFDRFYHSNGLCGHEWGVDILESGVGIYARQHQQVVCHALFEAQDCQQQVLGGYERALRALRFIASE